MEKTERALDMIKYWQPLHQLHELAQSMQTTMYEAKALPLRAHQKELWRNPAYAFSIADSA